MLSGSLTIVGTGIKFAGHITAEAQGYIEQAEKVLFALADYASMAWVTELNPTAEPFGYYSEGRLRKDTLDDSVEKMLDCVRAGLNVCAVFYGHPGVCMPPAHEAIKQARLEGFRAMMLPGISAEDCLFADLGVDPALASCQSFEATDFLIHRRKPDLESAVVIRQIGVVGEVIFKRNGDNSRGLHTLIKVLEEYYGSNYEVVVYEAAQFAIFEPRIQRVPLAQVPKARITELSTLYLPPRDKPALDLEMVERLGLPRQQFQV